MQKHNYFFEAYDISNNDSLGMIHNRLPELNLPETLENIKEHLKITDPTILIYFSNQLGKNILNDDNIGIRQISSYEYRKENPEYDNECEFIDYIISEGIKKDKHTNITHDLLRESGFIDKTTPLDKAMAEQYNITDYHNWELRTVDNYKLNLCNGLTNNGTEWNLHIDNCDYCTVGSADIDTIWQFNTMMEVLGIKFKLWNL